MDHPSYFTSSPSQNTPPNDPPASVLVQPSKPRNKLGPGGISLLEAYWSKNSNLLHPPPLSDRKELTRMIKELPGCGFWGDSNTSDWFKRRRKKGQSDIAYTSPPSKLISSSNDALQHLGVLLKSQPNPSPDVIKTWASLLSHEGGSLGVEIWIAYITQAVQSSNQSVALPPSANLPTPAGTVTPEPPIPASSSSNQDLHRKIKYDPANSPTLASLAIRPTQSTATSPSSSSTESPISPFYQTQPPAVSLRLIIEDAMHGSQDLDEIRRLPNDADEFIAMFAPYEAKLTRLLHILESEHY